MRVRLTVLCENSVGRPNGTIGEHGGTHLAPASDEQLAGTVRALRAFGVERIGVSHCTGLLRAAQLHAGFGGRFFFASVGSTLDL
jgi:7,8-dihydropterin-6-yl-methyl-4-(beta-D-ribofuranosyl)aminobenzene 5'-phosphate synthase